MKPKHAVDCSLYPLCCCHVGCAACEGRHGDRRAGVPPLAVLSTVVICAGALLAASYARADDALPTAAQSQGWYNPFSFCTGFDCREVANKAMGE